MRRPFHRFATSSSPSIGDAGVDVISTPGVIALSLTSFAPTVNTPRLNTPAKLALGLSSFAPQLKLSVIPGVHTLAIATFAPSVAAPRLVTPDVLALSLTTFAPVANAEHSVFVILPKSLSLSTFAPSAAVTINTIVTPSTLAIILQTYISVATVLGSHRRPAFALHSGGHAPIHLRGKQG